MLDTLDTLEAIGQDAGLRYAAPEDLTAASALAEASDALKTAIREGNGLALANEFGSRVMQLVQVNLSPGREDEEPEEEGDEPEPSRPTGPDSL